MLRNKIEINLLSRLNMSWLTLEYKPQVMQRIISWKLQEHKHLLTPLRVELELYQYVENCWIEQRFDFVQSQQLSQCMQQQQHQCCLMEKHWNFDVWLWNWAHLRAAKMISVGLTGDLFCVHTSSCWKTGKTESTHDELPLLSYSPCLSFQSIYIEEMCMRQ